MGRWKLFGFSSAEATAYHSLRHWNASSTEHWMCDAIIPKWSSISLVASVWTSSRMHQHTNCLLNEKSLGRKKRRGKQNKNVSTSAAVTATTTTTQYYSLDSMRLVTDIDRYCVGIQLLFVTRMILCSWKSENARCGDGTISVRSLPIHVLPFDSELSVDTRIRSMDEVDVRCDWLLYVGMGRVMPPISRIVFGSVSSSDSQDVDVTARDGIDDAFWCVVVISIFWFCFLFFVKNE